MGSPSTPGWPAIPEEPPVWLDGLLLPNVHIISCCLERSEWVTPLASYGGMKACVHKVHFKTFQFMFWKPSTPLSWTQQSLATFLEKQTIMEGG